jgi:hypothetical protein
MCRLYQFFSVNLNEKLVMTFGSAGFHRSASVEEYSFVGPILNTPWSV